jgi:hypothetical protein
MRCCGAARAVCRLKPVGRLRAGSRIFVKPIASAQKRTNLSLFSRLALHFPSPMQKTHDLPARLPEEIHHAPGRERLRLLPRIGFYSPAQIGASPRPKPVPARRIPDKSYRFEQGRCLAQRIAIFIGFDRLLPCATREKLLQSSDISICKSEGFVPRCPADRSLRPRQTIAGPISRPAVC